MNVQIQRAPHEDRDTVQMTAQLPCFEYYSAPRDAFDALPAPAPLPGVAVLDQMYGYFD